MANINDVVALLSGQVSEAYGAGPGVYDATQRSTAGVVVQTASDTRSLTLSLDTNAYTAGDVLADTQELTNCVRVPAGKAVIQSLVVYDDNDQKQPFTVYVLRSNVSMGTENSAPSITDANAHQIEAVIDVAAADYKDLGGCAVANLKNIGAVVEAGTGSTSLWVAVVNGTGTPTYSASGLRLRFGFLQD